MHPQPKRRLARLPLLLGSTLALAGCFGEGDGPEEIAGTPLPSFTGVLIDSPVAGVSWEESGGQSGITGSTGEFQYTQNALVTFSIGDIVLGTAPGAPFITPVELTNSLDPNDPASVNQLVFLQSIDSDQDPSNGITVSDGTRAAAAGQSLDFFADDFGTQVASVVAAIAPGNSVVEETVALLNFYDAYAELGGTDTFDFGFAGFPPVGGGVAFELVFSDEFDTGTAPDSEKWNIELGYGDNGWGNNEWQLYTDSPDNLRVEDGNLVIQARCDTPPCGIRDDTVTSARINTKDKFEFRYGVVQARIQVPVGEGSWPAFWSLGAVFPEIPWPRAGEIDFMELSSFFDDEFTTLFTMHWCPDGSQAPVPCNRTFFTQRLSLNESLGDDFFVYEAEWNSERVIGRINGIPYFELEIDPNTMEEFLNDFFLILNVAMGGTLGSNGAPPSGNEVWPQTMLVDYVRVYQQVGGVEPEPLITVVDFEEPPETYVFSNFEGGVSTVLANPVPEGVNTSAQVARMQKFAADSGFTFGGSTLSLDSPINIDDGREITMKVYATRAVPVLFKIEGATDADDAELNALHTGTGWEELAYDFSDYTGTVSGITLIFDNGVLGGAGDMATAQDWTFYFDDITVSPVGTAPSDQTPPTLTSVSIASNNANSAALAKAGDVVTLTFEPSEPLANPVVTFAGLAADSVVADGAGWSATRTLTGDEGDGNLAFSVEYFDLAGNEGTPVTGTTDASAVVLDFTPPAVTFSNVPMSFTDIVLIPLTVEFSETVSGFDVSDIVPTNGDVIDLTQTDDLTYVVNVSPLLEGDLTVTIEPGAVMDAAGNLNTTAAIAMVANEVPPGTPTLQVNISSNNTTTMGPMGFAKLNDVVTLTMTSPVDIDPPTVTLASLAPDSLTFDGTSWLATLTMTESVPEGPIDISVTNVISTEGVAGPDRFASTDGSTMTYDRTPPTLSIDGVPDDLASRDPLTVTFDFGEAVVGFDAGDIMVTNGVADTLTSEDGAVYTAVVSPDYGPAQGETLTVSVDADAATDPAGNGNPAASDSGTLGTNEPFWELVWVDDFESGALDTSIWTARNDIDCPDPCDATDGINSYSDASVTVGDFTGPIPATYGALQIQAQSGMPFVSGLVDTKGKREFTYGRVEIDALMPAANGALPFFKLLPATDTNYGPWPRSGEIDIVNAPEIGVVGEATLEHSLRFGLAEPEDTTTTATYEVPATGPATSVPVRYAIEWEAGEIRWYVTTTVFNPDPDGLDTGTVVQVGTQDQDNWYAYYPQDASGVPTTSSAGEPFDQDFYLVMGLAVEGDPVTGDPPVNTLYPATLAVDEVRVFRCANGDNPAAMVPGCSGIVDGGAPPAPVPVDPPNEDLLDVYLTGPATLDFADPEGGADIPATLLPESEAIGSANVMSVPDASDGSNTVWNVNVAATAGSSGRVSMRAPDRNDVAGFFNLLGSEGAGELLFRMRVNPPVMGDPDPAVVIKAGMESTGAGRGLQALDFTADGEWRDYSVSIADLVANSVADDTGLTVISISNIFVLEASEGSVNLDLDDIRVKVACRADNTCEATPRFRLTTERFSESFESLDPMDPAALAPSGAQAPNAPDLTQDWGFFATVFDGLGTFKFNFGTFPAPNATVSPNDTFVSAIVTGEGGDDQGANVLSVFSDYNCCDIGTANPQGHGNGTDLVEIAVFRELTLEADDIGSVYSFSFDAKRGNIDGDTEAVAFIKTIDPDNMFAQTNFVTIDMTNLDAADGWLRYTIELPIADSELEGQLFQFGFQTTAKDFEPSGNFYDNIVVIKAN